MASDAAHSRKSRLAVPSGGGDPLLTSSPGTSSARPKISLQQANHSAPPVANRPMQYLQRLTDVRQMDIQSALDQMKTLLSTRPQVVYKTAYYRKQTKNHWARDDPAFVALQAVFLVISSIAYSVAFRIKVPGAISFLLATVVWNWLGMGMLIATASREIANRYLTVTQSSSHVRQQVEWLYAFDIHCNSFFPVFVVLCKYDISKTMMGERCTKELSSYRVLKCPSFLNVFSLFPQTACNSLLFQSPWAKACCHCLWRIPCTPLPSVGIGTLRTWDTAHCHFFPTPKSFSFPWRRSFCCT